MKSRLYFDARCLPSPQCEYVLWCDAMGTARNLTRSFRSAAKSIFNIQAAFAIAIAKADGARCYPMMDGVYVTCRTHETMVKILRIAFYELGMDFRQGLGTEQKYMVRAGLAFGPTLHGGDLDEKAFYGLLPNGMRKSRDDYEATQMPRIRGQILLSPAMVQAYNAERRAPPFGIFVDDTAKLLPQAFDTLGFPGNLHRWWRGDERAEALAVHLYDQIEFYFEKAELDSVGMGYDLESINRHRVLAKEYFREVVVKRGGKGKATKR
jgi:hypothetical protein